MGNAEIVRRAKSYFMRHAAWCERSRVELEKAARGILDAAHAEGLSAIQASQAADLCRFEEEFEAMTVAWKKAADLADAERQVVRALARKASAAAAQLMREIERADAKVAARMKGLEASHDALRRGRDMMSKYRVYENPSSGVLNKEA